ncbi:Golgi-associated plant pathogenesis-related protein 1-like [Ixodes scapularis]|uniref:Golgi-associated plant pathogenesis-related protein 1-like n=1 Tax=Ixodes scapularis TaxID=6945 RepID=UPI001C393F66|nr:Golgi-associated plant pathogenesis-related protein 1-like [Ixodes scapularis]
MRTTVHIFMFSVVMMLGLSEDAPKTLQRGGSRYRTPRPNNPNHRFHQLCRKAQNQYRVKHHAPPLKTNSTLYILARGWAKRLAIQDDTKNVTHRPGKGLGENIYWTTLSTPPYEKYAQMAVDMWYEENVKYNYHQGGYSAATSHFTQLVWISSTQVGCGYSVSSSKTLYVVCNYYPQGNIEGKYKENVKPPSTYH